MRKLTRRSLFRRSAAAAGSLFFAPVIVPRSVLGQGETPPSEKITLAGIGVGGIGRPQLKQARDAGFEIAALCDIDPRHAAGTFKDHPDARIYKDFRELLAAEGDKIDAVYCGSPDHTHAIISLAALRAGKHLCCVKPLTRTIGECRAVAEAARSAKTATQVTMQPNTSEEASRIMELILAGAIGEIREVHAWSARPVWPQGMTDWPSFTSPVPDGFDWTAWLGPAESRPFAEEWPTDSPLPAMACANWGKRAVYHPFNFRGWTAFGTGSLGDMGCHRANLPYRLFELKYPTRVTASNTKMYPVAFPLACSVAYDYPASEKFPPIRLVWYDGGLKPPVPKDFTGGVLPDEGVLYIGDQGTMLNGELLDPARAEKFKETPRTIKRRGGVFPEWLEACKGGEPASANFEFAVPVTEFVLLGNLALLTGKPVEFDPVALTVRDNPEAEALIHPTYHNGWTL